MTLPSARMENGHSPSISGFADPLPWIFIVADVQKPILGANFLRHFGLLVDMK